MEEFFAVGTSFFDESLDGGLAYYLRGVDQVKELGVNRTFWVITIEQTMQARRWRCWFGATKLSDMVGGIWLQVV